MPTYVSILNWSGDPQPSIADVRAAIDEHTAVLALKGLHSVAFLPDEGECAAIMVATCDDEAAVARLAASILGDAEPRVDTMLFDDDPGTRAEVTGELLPPPPGDYRRRLLAAIVEGG
jgi:hypothetical protein